MPPSLALFLWFVLLVALFRYDPGKDKEASAALWIPLVWLFILGSRLPSQWFGGYRGAAADVYLEGSPLDRAIFLTIAFMALVVLFRRSFRWGEFFANNLGLVAFLGIALLSVTWSDYPFISLKRWVRDVSGYLALMVVLTERNVIASVLSVLRRLAFLLVPLSIVFVKYFENLGRSYEAWSGSTAYQGVATSKNMLGVLCLMSVLYFFWDLLNRFPHRKEKVMRRAILVDLAFLAMTLWLMTMARSATSGLCVALGVVLIAVGYSNWSRKHPIAFRMAAPILIGVYVVLEVAFGINAVIAGGVGRDPTLTDRTDIWTLVLSMGTNPLLGTGYESFWLGPRLDILWAKYQGLNHAHNGYIETYLNLGLLGLVTLVIWLFTSYAKICRTLNESSRFATLGLAIWTILLFYNITEAAFKAQLLFAAFLMTMFVANAQRASVAPRAASARLRPRPHAGARWGLSPAVARMSAASQQRQTATGSVTRSVTAASGRQGRPGDQKVQSPQRPGRWSRRGR